MPPKRSPGTPTTASFSVVDLRAGRKSWAAGSSGQPVHLRGEHGSPSKSIARREITLHGKVLFGLSRFAFELQDFDNDTSNVAKLLKNNGREYADTYFGVLLAKQFAALSSIQVKFEDIEGVERAGNTITLRLRVPPSCYQKPAGKSSTGNLQVAKDLTHGAKMLQFTIGPPNVGLTRDNRTETKQLEFAQVQSMVMAHSPHLQALFMGQPSPVIPDPVTPQKKRKSEAPASISKRLKKEARGKACSASDAAAVDADSGKCKLNDFVKSLAAAVDADWHDSYEETGEMLQEWFGAVGNHAQNILRVSVARGEEFGQSHELLKQIFDTWANIQAIPFRGCPRDDISNGDGVSLFDDKETGEGTVSCPDEVLAFTWPVLLARAAADEKVPETALFQMIKDAHDRGVTSPHRPATREGEMKLSRASQRACQQGRCRLGQLFERQSEWSGLPSTKAKHRMRRCIDRRFDGPKHLRTRDFSSDDEGGDNGCSVM